MRLKDILLSIVVVALWGFSFVAIRWGLDEAPPLLLNAFRFAFAAIPLVFILPRPPVAWSRLITYGALLGLGQLGILSVAIKLGMPAGLSSLVIQMQVFFTILFAAIVLGEKPAAHQILGAGIAFLGLLVIATGRLNGAAFGPFLMVVFAAIAWGVANIVSKQAGKVDPLAFISWTSLVAPPFLLLGSWLTEDHARILNAVTHPGIKLIASVAFISYAATLFCFGTWNALLRRYQAATVSPFALLVPVFGIGSSAILLNETLALSEIVGGVGILAGLAVNLFGGRVKRPSSAMPHS